MNKIIVADNQGVFRTGIAKVLSMEDDFRIIAQCQDLERLEAAIDTFRDVTVVFGSSMKHDPSLLMQLICSRFSRGIVMLENRESSEAYLAAHVHGLCFRSISGHSFVECVRRVARGERVIQSGGSFNVHQEEDSVGIRVRDNLTPKELKIVALITQGYKNREIGLRLSTTEQVIKNYLRGIYDKTGASDRLELALFTIHHRELAKAAALAGKQIEPTPARVRLERLDNQLGVSSSHSVSTIP